MCFSKHLIYYGWQEGGKRKSREKERLRIQRDQSSQHEEYRETRVSDKFYIRSLGN